jgi:DNA-binding CsgD family transcriptional regulator
MQELQRLSPALWGLAETALVAGDAVEAVRWCELGRAASAAVDDAAYLFPFLVTGTRAYLAGQDPAAAEAWVEDLSSRIRRRGVPGTLSAVAHAEGLVALAAGSTGRARMRLRDAVAGWASSHRSWEGIAARIDLAECELRTNRLTEAARLAMEVRTLAEALPSPPLQARADAVLGRIRAQHPDDAPWAPLTAREWQVARLVSAGETSARIASTLDISPRTADSHVEHILAKLGARRRTEIAAWVAGVERDGGGANGTR